MQKIWKFCNLQFLVYKVFVKPETSIEGTLIGHVGLQTISTASLKFGDTLLGEKKIFRTRNGFLLTDFVLQNKPKFWVVRTGAFPWNNRNYHVLSSLWNSIDVYLKLLEKETMQRKQERWAPERKVRKLDYQFHGVACFWSSVWACHLCKIITG